MKSTKVQTLGAYVLVYCVHIPLRMRGNWPHLSILTTHTPPSLIIYLLAYQSATKIEGWCHVVVCGFTEEPLLTSFLFGAPIHPYIPLHFKERIIHAQ